MSRSCHASQVTRSRREPGGLRRTSIDPSAGWTVPCAACTLGSSGAGAASTTARTSYREAISSSASQ